MCLRSNLRGHVTASALVLGHDDTCLLLIHHRIAGRWLQPGGHVEPGQLLWHSACREVVEETGVLGLERAPFPAFLHMPIDIDTHAIAARAHKAEAAHWHHDYLYLARADAQAPLQAQLSEVDAARWVPRAWLDTSPDPRFQRVALKLQRLFSSD
jgi:8-oxo-dGTP pyrophosphatase MutT (NUDIX family)